MNRILPAYPLWIMDPMFSVWSKSEMLNASDTMFWTGQLRRTYGFVRYNGTTYCFLGRRDDAVSLEQTDLEVSAFSTKYTFECEEFILRIDFLSPLLLTDIRLMSRPVCYTAYSIEPKNAKPDDLSIALALSEEYCYNKERASVIGGVLPCKGFEAAYFTRYRNCILSETDDTVAPDWGSTYLAGEESFFITEVALNRYISEGVAQYIRKETEYNYLLSINRSLNGIFMTAFDDYVSIFYFGEWLKGFYFKDGSTIIDAMEEAALDYKDVSRRCTEFDVQLKNDCRRIGEGYYLLACAALRQSIGAHKLVQNRKGELLFLSKECNSNGCIGTADISYPSMPLYLLYNPELVNAMLVGIFEFARMPVWPFEFAPHDIGTYPWCCGQQYGVSKINDKYGCGLNWIGGKPNTKQMLYLRPAGCKVYNIEEQMPVEECGNMLIMTAAGMVAGGSIKLAEKNFDLLASWVQYLEKYGFKPKSQLCTDDFSGHLANNVNLAIKALVGIESFSVICGKLKKERMAAQYREKAKKFAAALKREVGKDIWPLAYEKEDTYSLKYNILFDKLFGFHLIDQEICERETNYYIEKQEYFGTPLDNRASYTKSDWILWVATLTDEQEKTEVLYKPVLRYLAETPSRLPFGDWYYADRGDIVEFYNRAVQGGVFAPLLRQSGKMQVK